MNVRRATAVACVVLIGACSSGSGTDRVASPSSLTTTAGPPDASPAAFVDDDFAHGAPAGLPLGPVGAGAVTSINSDQGSYDLTLPRAAHGTTVALGLPSPARADGVVTAFLDSNFRGATFGVTCRTQPGGSGYYYFAFYRATTQWAIGRVSAGTNVFLAHGSVANLGPGSIFTYSRFMAIRASCRGAALVLALASGADPTTGAHEPYRTVLTARDRTFASGNYGLYAESPPPARLALIGNAVSPVVNVYRFKVAAQLGAD